MSKIGTLRDSRTADKERHIFFIIGNTKNIFEFIVLRQSVT
jgi:hypothetical protein